MAGEIEPLWPDLSDVLDIHRGQLASFGGAEGVRDQDLIESALMRPQNMFYYESVEDALSLAIRLGVGLAQNHGFVDGNKRTGLVAMIGGGEDDATAFDFARELGGWSSAVAVMPEGCEV